MALGLCLRVGVGCIVGLIFGRFFNGLSSIGLFFGAGKGKKTIIFDSLVDCLGIFIFIAFIVINKFRYYTQTFKSMDSLLIFLFCDFLFFIYKY